jgi:hypothetical protein
MLPNSAWLLAAYAPSTKKLYFEISKFLDEIFYMYIFTIYMYSSFVRNQNFVYDCGICARPFVVVNQVGLFFVHANRRSQVNTSLDSGAHETP